jgi:hypothetical protein
MAQLAYAPILKKIFGLAQAARVSGGSPYSTATIDLANTNANMVEFLLGTWTDGTHTFSLNESSDDSTYTACATADVIVVGTNPVVANTNVNTFVQLSYIGTKRYIKGVITSAGTTTGLVAGGNATLKNRKQP